MPVRLFIHLVLQGRPCDRKWPVRFLG